MDNADIEFEQLEAVMRGSGQIVGVIVLVWLLIGVLANWQRGNFSNGETNCATAGTIALTVIAGPLNYFGVNPKVTECNLPEPSSSALLSNLPAEI